HHSAAGRIGARFAGGADGIDGGGEAELGVAVDPADLLGPEVLDGVEVLHLAGEADGEAGGVEARDVGRHRPPGQQRLPERGDVVAGRGLQPEAGHDDPGPMAMVEVVRRRPGAGDRGAAHALAPSLPSTSVRAWPTVSTPSRSSSGTEMSNRSSRAMTNSTRSRLSASRSSLKRASSVTADGSTARTSTAASFRMANASARSIAFSFWWCEIGSVPHGEPAIDRNGGPGYIP